MNRFFVATRYLIIIPVIGLGLAAAAFFIFGGIGLIRVLIEAMGEILGLVHIEHEGEQLPIVIEVVEFVHTFLIGTVLYIASMWVNGILQGLMWRAYNQDGTLTYSFVESVAASYPGYVVRVIGGGIFFAGMLVIGLIGLGIDFGVHYVARYLQERKTIHRSDEALVETARGVGPGIVTGAVTTAATRRYSRSSPS